MVLNQHKIHSYRNQHTPLLAVGLLIAVLLSGCRAPVKENRTALPGFSSFDRIPGVTAEEIKSINALREEYGSFVYGANPGTEAFYDENGNLAGFTALLNEWLTELFDIPFIPVIIEWGDLLEGLEAKTIDFTGDMTATDERLKTYYMTGTIAERSVKFMRIKDAESNQENGKRRTPRYAFLEGTTTVDEVAALTNYSFDSLFVNDYAAAYVLLESGEADAFIDEGIAEAAFDYYGNVYAEDFFPMIYSPVSLTTQNPALKPVISVMQKALLSGANNYLTVLYNRGHDDYIKHKLSVQFTDAENEYIRNNPVIRLAAEYDNYPVSFFNMHEKQWQGITFDILERVTDLTGIEFEIVNNEKTERPELLRMLEAGEASMISELIRIESREGRFLWPGTILMKDNYALISTLDRHNININEILHTKIGLVKGTAHMDVFRHWFPNHSDTVVYDTINLAFNALQRGEAEMVMASQTKLLILTNYLELPGFKANFVFGRSYDSIFGFNKEEELLTSIISKALPLIDTKGISGQWVRRTYDYREKIARSRIPWLAGAAVLFLVILILLLAFFQRNRNESKRLEGIVLKRTSESARQNRLMHVVNDVASSLLEVDRDEYLKGMIGGMELIGRCVDVDRVSVWQNHRKEDGKLYYKVVCQWATEGLPELDVHSYFAYEELVPSWEALFSRGEWVNGPVDELPEPERSVLTAFTMKSILAVPIFLKGHFWGFVSFDDYRSRRTFPEAELHIMRSWGLVIVSAIQRREILLNMERALNKLEAVINNYKGVIWSVDREGKITTFNGQYLKKIGLEPSSLEGKDLEAARQKYRHMNIIENVQKTFAEGPQEWTSEIDGGIFRSYTRPMDEDGVITGVVGSTDEVTELYKLQKDLENALVDAKAASHAKSVFLANMSHEIRTPLNAIIGMTNIGKTAGDSEKKDYCFVKIDDASKHLLGVINDILDMSKIEANKFDIASVEFNFEKMLERVVNVVNFRVDEKKQKFTVHIDSAIPRILVGDDQRLAQVITNLTGNSVKFTPEGGSISLDARLVKEEDGIFTVQISVSDSGIGISEEQQARLFQSFQQAEVSIARKFGGTGLGLSISKNIVEMMGGRIWVNSEPGKGSTFTFTIQAKKGEEKPGWAADREALWHNVRFLAVDDDPEVLKFFSETMKKHGASCDVALSAEEALALADRKGLHDIYFIDWKLPGIDGLELTRLLNERAKAEREITVIMFTAADWSGLTEQAREMGVFRFLSKPLFQSTIAETVNDALGMGTQQSGDEKPDLEGLFAGRRILLAEDVEINREIVLALLEPTHLKIDCAENGAAAVKMFNESPGKYDMIFMDVQMPEMDGYTATRSIRSLEAAEAKTIPIVAMTANVFREDVEKCLAAGMNDHVGKPLDLDEVIEKLRAFVA